jgi:hypothetical protein
MADLPVIVIIKTSRSLGLRVIRVHAGALHRLVLSSPLNVPDAKIVAALRPQLSAAEYYYLLTEVE